MALADWETILGGNLTLDTTYKVSGDRSLTQNFNGGATHIVHKNTYTDSPLNVEIRTWMTIKLPDYDFYDYIVGGIARKQSDAKTYFYICVIMRFDQNGYYVTITGSAGYYINGSQTEVVSQDITQDFVDKLGLSWVSGKWRFVRFIGYESDGKFNMTLEMTPDIDTPDVNNPPLDQLKSIFSASIEIPTELQNGGACGLVVGGVKPTGSNATTANPYYDYTQIYY